MLEILRAHRARYPLMTPQDAVVLLHQRAFGPSREAGGREEALRALLMELSQIKKDPEVPLFEPLSGELVRMNLASPDFPRPETAAGFVFASALAPSGKSFDRELSALPRAWPECARYIAEYREQGCPPPAHSEAYRRAYHPAYRVVSAVFQRLFEVFRRIDELADRPRLMIAIDGRCGSGKSSLAQRIASVSGATVLHMDDFFQTERQKSAGERAAVANIDGARLMAALTPFAAGEPFEFRPYDCLTGEFLPSRLMRPGRIRVVEGSYCLHPAIHLGCDLKIFLTIDPITQKARLKARNPELYDRFVEEWIPQEERYFEAYRVQDGCLTVDGRSLSQPGDASR